MCPTAWCATTAKTAWMPVMRTSVSTPLAPSLSSLSAPIDRYETSEGGGGEGGGGLGLVHSRSSQGESPATD